MISRNERRAWTTLIRVGVVCIAGAGIWPWTDYLAQLWWNWLRRAGT